MLTVINMDHRKQWDAIVCSFKDYDIYWKSGYVKAFQIHGDGEPLLFYFEGSDTRGINVVMKRDIAKGKNHKGKIHENQYFDFSSPYGYGGWLIEGNDTTELFKVYEEWCDNNNIISEFVRFHPLIKNHVKSFGFYDVVQLGKVVHMDIASPEIIWNNLTSKNRNMIRKAKKNGVEIHYGRTPELFEIFRKIYNTTMDKDDAGRYYYFKPPFYESIQNDLKQHSLIFYAVKNEDIIATSIMLMNNNMINYHLSGSKREYNSFAPSNLLLYETALWGCENGYKTLYLGGGVGSEEDNLFKFKKAFNRGDLNHFYIGKRVYDSEKYNLFATMRENIYDTEFFPIYRAE